MSDRERLAGYVEVWWSAIETFLDLLEQVPDEQWSRPTDLAGWDVRACVAHTVHLESVLAGRGEESAEVGEAAHLVSPMGFYTEVGVVNRSSATKAALLAELREVATARHQRLLADPPTDASAPADIVFGAMAWTWETLLRNRTLDVWMHEQDIRRALDRPGGYDSPAARHTIDYLTEGRGYVLAKRAGAEPGTTMVMEIGAAEPRAFVVGPEGRGRELPPGDLPAQPTVRLRMDEATFVVLAGGRRAAEAGAVVVEGDAELGERILAGMATTP